MPTERHMPRGERDSGREPESRVDREATQPTAVIRLVVRGALGAESAKAKGRARPEAGVRFHVSEAAAAEDQRRPKTKLPTRETSRSLERSARPMVQA